MSYEIPEGICTCDECQRDRSQAAVIMLEHIASRPRQFERLLNVIAVIYASMRDQAVRRGAEKGQTQLEIKDAFDRDFREQLIICEKIMGTFPDTEQLERAGASALMSNRPFKKQ